MSIVRAINGSGPVSDRARDREIQVDSTAQCFPPPANSTPRSDLASTRHSPDMPTKPLAQCRELDVVYLRIGVTLGGEPWALFEVVEP